MPDIPKTESQMLKIPKSGARPAGLAVTCSARQNAALFARSVQPYVTTVFNMRTTSATAGVPSLGDAPSFGVYLNRLKHAIVQSDLDPPGAVGDELTIGGFAGPGLDARKGIPIELWETKDLAELYDFAEAACLKRNAEALNLWLEPFPPR